jgi:transposase
MYMKKSDMKKVPVDPTLNVVVPGKRAKFEDDFKRLAVERMRDGLITKTELAAQLGIRRNQLYKWAKIFGSQLPGESFKNPGRPVAAEPTEVEQLRRKLTVVEEELAILKKFDAYLTRRKQ